MSITGILITFCVIVAYYVGYQRGKLSEADAGISAILRILTKALSEPVEHDENKKG